MAILVRFDIPLLSKTHFYLAQPDESIEDVLPELRKLNVPEDAKFKCGDSFYTETTFGALAQNNSTINPISKQKELSISVSFVIPYSSHNQANEDEVISPDIKPPSYDRSLISKKYPHYFNGKDTFESLNPFSFIDGSKTELSSSKATSGKQQNSAPEKTKPEEKKHKRPSRNSSKEKLDFSAISSKPSIPPTNSQSSFSSQNQTSSSYDRTKDKAYIPPDTLNNSYQMLSAEDKKKVDRLLETGNHLAIVLQYFEACDHDEELTRQALSGN